MDTKGKLHHKIQALKPHHPGKGVGTVLGEYDLDDHGKSDHGKSEGEHADHGKADQLAAHAKQAASQAGDAARHAGKRLKKRAMRRLGMFHARLHEAGGRVGGRARDHRGPEV